MRIIFNLVNCGLGSNGGSQTIVKSANTLVELGNEVYIIDSGKNQYTWDELIAKHIIIKDESDIPNADVIIATGYRTWEHTNNLPNRCGAKFVYIRGWETWQAPENNLIKTLKETNLTKIVNSICLRRKLTGLGFSPYLIRPGYDLDKYHPLENNIKKTDSIVVLGGLFNSGKKRKGKRTEWIIKAANKLKEEYRNIKLWMFGADPVKIGNFVDIDSYKIEPSHTVKNRFYNLVDIWLAPTELEGLHIAPAEAMLTQCPVVGTNAPMNGMEDYLENFETGLVTENDLTSFTNGTRSLIENPGMRKRLGENARKKILEIGDRKKNMKKLVELLGSF